MWEKYRHEVREKSLIHNEWKSKGAKERDSYFEEFAHRFVRYVENPQRAGPLHAASERATCKHTVSQVKGQGWGGVCVWSVWMAVRHGCAFVNRINASHTQVRVTLQNNVIGLLKWTQWSKQYCVWSVIHILTQCRRTGVYSLRVRAHIGHQWPSHNYYTVRPHLNIFTFTPLHRGFVF